MCRFQNLKDTKVEETQESFEKGQTSFEEAVEKHCEENKKQESEILKTFFDSLF